MSGVAFAELAWDGRPVRIEHRWIDGPAAAPLLVFLHEGLGSVAMWKDWPDALCAQAGVRGLVYSRPGYGRSTPRPAGQPLQPDFMHRQAVELLPALLDALGLDTAASPPWLLGHSDGGSIALLHAAAFPGRVAGAVVMAPHLFVEPVSIASIRAAREAFASTDLPARLGRYHDDVQGAFRGWNDIWLHPAFAGWNIEAELAPITCPLLAVQGVDDEYGTLAQIRRIRERLPATELLELPRCGHSPHRDQPVLLNAAITAFLQRHRGAAARPA